MYIHSTHDGRRREKRMNNKHRKRETFTKHESTTPGSKERPVTPGRRPLILRPDSEQGWQRAEQTSEQTLLSARERRAEKSYARLGSFSRW